MKSRDKCQRRFCFNRTWLVWEVSFRNMPDEHWENLKEIFHAAVALKPDERRGVLGARLQR